MDKINDMGVIVSTFVDGVREIRELEAECEKHIGYFIDNKQKLENAVNNIIK